MKKALAREEKNSDLKKKIQRMYGVISKYEEVLAIQAKMIDSVCGRPFVMRIKDAFSKTAAVKRIQKISKEYKEFIEKGDVYEPQNLDQVITNSISETSPELSIISKKENKNNGENSRV